MTLTLSIIAIFISITSLGFSIYQYTRGSKIKINERINDLLKEIYDLRRDIEDKKNLYANTDDIPDYAELFSFTINSIESSMVPFLKNGKMTIEELHQIEREYMNMRTEIDLTCKQIEEAIRFNEECVSAGMEPMKFESHA